MLAPAAAAATSSLLGRVLPVVELHAEGAAQRGGGLGVGDLHDVDVAVGGAEVTAVQRGNLGLGLLEGGPRSVLQYSSKLGDRGEDGRTERSGV